MAATCRPKAHNSHPMVNVSDLPELLPGAQCNANPAQREEFEQQCRLLYKEEIEHQYHFYQRHPTAHIGTDFAASSDDMVAMFPSIDPVLIRTLVEEARTPQDAIETLLELSGMGYQRAATPPPLQLGVEDMEKFPSLVDADGWQVFSQRHMERGTEENFGSTWRDRAKAGIPLPAPTAVFSSARGTVVVKRRERKEQESDATENTTTTDYDVRHRKGQQRVKNRMHYGRGSHQIAPFVTNVTHEKFAEDDSTNDAFSDACIAQA
mmetsp:Transcript_102506/g.161800  ORF Transcript_102506/g.161800 Transcript_102506/m.161800 type:complete len:265 (-) Transcript_102506:100-894(-)